jgi:hypothetical protein
MAYVFSNSLIGYKTVATTSCKLVTNIILNSTNRLYLKHNNFEDFSAVDNLFMVGRDLDSVV